MGAQRKEAELSSNQKGGGVAGGSGCGRPTPPRVSKALGPKDSGRSLLGLFYHLHGLGYQQPQVVFAFSPPRPGPRSRRPFLGSPLTAAPAPATSKALAKIQPPSDQQHQTTGTSGPLSCPPELSTYWLMSQIPLTAEKPSLPQWGTKDRKCKRLAELQSGNNQSALRL